jgi:hypothetical protein
MATNPIALPQIPLLGTAVPLQLSGPPPAGQMIASAAAAGGAPKAHSLPPFMQTQEQTNWCWAAVGTSIGLLFGTGPWTQCETATACLNLPGLNCCVTPDTCNVYGFLDLALSHTRSLAALVSGTETAAVLESELDSNRPVCARIAWDGQGAHFLAISGYSDPQGDGTQITIELEDPFFGAASMLLAEFPANYHSGGAWTDSYLTRAQP